MQTTKEDLNFYKQFAKKYRDHGYSVIPCKFQSKIPAIKQWSDYCYRFPTNEEMESWFINFQESNLDVALGEASGIIALDIDTTDQRILDTIMPILPESPVVKKGSKGETRFFRFSGEVTETLKFNGEMVIEILSNNKKTTIPPSIHPNGASYIWTTERGLLDIDKRELPILPPALFAHLGSVLRSKFPDLEQPSLGKTISGRNNNLSSLCGNLIKEKVSIGTAIAELIKADVEKNDPPLFTDPNEFRHTEPVTNALMFYSNHLSTINNKHFRDKKEYEVPVIPKGEVTSPEKEVDSGKQKGESQKNLSEVLQLAPTVLKTLHSNLLDNSWIKQPELALGAILTLGATLTSRKVVFQGLSPNLYVLNISPSGSGKDKPQSYVKEILINMRADSLLGSGDYVSDASLMDGLANKPVRLDILDEAGGILRSVNTGKSEYNGKMADVLAELYTSSNTKYLGRQTAEGNKGECYRPNVNILASTTPTGFSEGVSRKAIEKGLMGRFLIFIGTSSNRATRLSAFPKLPNHVLDQLRFWYGFRVEDYCENAGELEIGGITQTFIDIKATEAAERRLDEVFQEFDDLRRRTNEADAKLPIISRLYQQMVKIVIISSCFRTIQDVPVIQEKDVEFGRELILFYYDNFKKVVNSYIFENATQMRSQKILNVIESYGGVITKKKLYKLTRGFTKREREAIIEDLEASGLLMRDMQNIDGHNEIIFRRLL